MEVNCRKDIWTAEEMEMTRRKEVMIERLDGRITINFNVGYIRYIWHYLCSIVVAE